MKRVFVILSVFIIFFQIQTFAKETLEHEMKKKADELSYAGQLDRAAELMGKVDKSSKQTSDDGWSMTSLMLGMIWGSIGTGYFIYGKKQSRAVFLLCGIGLCVFPLVISDNTWGTILGLGMTVAPFKIDF